MRMLDPVFGVFKAKVGLCRACYVSLKRVARRLRSSSVVDDSDHQGEFPEDSAIQPNWVEALVLDY